MFFFKIDDDVDIIPMFFIIFIFVLVLIIIAVINDKEDKYGYIDLDGNEGISTYCKENYCEVNNKTITVKEYWKIESEEES